jgi:hypothetical protein
VGLPAVTPASCLGYKGRKMGITRLGKQQRRCPISSAGALAVILLAGCATTPANTPSFGATAAPAESSSVGTCIWRMTSAEMLSPVAGSVAGTAAAPGEGSLFGALIGPFVAPYNIYETRKALCDPKVSYSESYTEYQNNMTSMVLSGPGSGAAPSYSSLQSPCVNGDPNAICGPTTE